MKELFEGLFLVFLIFLTFMPEIIQDIIMEVGATSGVGGVLVALSLMGQVSIAIPIVVVLGLAVLFILRERYLNRHNMESILEEGKEVDILDEIADIEERKKKTFKDKWKGFKIGKRKNKENRTVPKTLSFYSPVVGANNETPEPKHDLGTIARTLSWASLTSPLKALGEKKPSNLQPLSSNRDGLYNPTAHSSWEPIVRPSRSSKYLTSARRAQSAMDEPPPSEDDFDADFSFVADPEDSGEENEHPMGSLPGHSQLAIRIDDRRPATASAAAVAAISNPEGYSPTMKTLGRSRSRGRLRRRQPNSSAVLTVADPLEEGTRLNKFLLGDEEFAHFFESPKRDDADGEEDAYVLFDEIYKSINEGEAPSPGRAAPRRSPPAKVRQSEEGEVIDVDRRNNEEQVIDVDRYRGFGNSRGDDEGGSVRRMPTSSPPSSLVTAQRGVASEDDDYIPEPAERSQPINEEDVIPSSHAVSAARESTRVNREYIDAARANIGDAVVVDDGSPSHEYHYDPSTVQTTRARSAARRRQQERK